MAVPVTGGWETFVDVSTSLSGAPAGTTTLYLTFSGGTGALFDVDAFTLSRATGQGPIRGSGRCVDIAGAATADGTNVQLYDCNATAAQTWTVSGATLRALGKCMDVAGGATADGTRVQLWTCNGSGAQNWATQADGTLRNPQSAKCLNPAGGNTAGGTQLVISPCTGAASQRWTLP
jgi:hypothetical protein